MFRILATVRLTLVTVSALLFSSLVLSQSDLNSLVPDNLSEVTLLITLEDSRYGPYFYFEYEPRVFTPSGAEIVTYKNSTIVLWDTFSVLPLKTIPISIDEEHVIGNPDLNLAFSMDGKYFATASLDDLNGNNTIRLFEFETGRQISTILSDNYCCHELRLSADGSQLIVSGDTIEVWDVISDERLLQRFIDGHVGVLPDGRMVVLTDVTFSSDRPLVVNLVDLADEHSLTPTELKTTQAMPNRDWSIVALADSHGVIELWDTLHENLRATLRTQADVDNLAFSGDGRVLVARDNENAVYLWDTTTGELRKSFHLGDVEMWGFFRHEMALNFDGSVLVFLDQEDKLHLWNVDTATEEKVLPGISHVERDTAGTNDLLVSPDGNTIAVIAGSFLVLYGVPTEGRPIYAAVPGRIRPSSINIREKPSFDAAIIAQVPEGNVLVSGRDSSGMFVYINSYGGWANADPTYIDLGSFELNLLPIRES